MQRSGERRGWANAYDPQALFNDIPGHVLVFEVHDRFCCIRQGGVDTVAPCPDTQQAGSQIDRIKAELVKVIVLMHKRIWGWKGYLN
jgi:hypothetical protein